MRLCPTNGEPCVNIAGCRTLPEDMCNKPIPISEFIAKSPENATIMEKFLEDLKSGKICMS